MGFWRFSGSGKEAKGAPIYEGLVNDRIVYNVKSLYHTDIKRLIDAKALFVVQDAQEILSKIKSKKVPLGKINKEDMFKSNSLINVEQVVEQILQEANVN